MKTIVIYHDHCADGFCCAWLLRKVYPDAEFVPATYDGSPPPDVTDANVFVVDFSYDRKTMLAMALNANSLLVLDHHKTSSDSLAHLSFAEFDMELSGAQMVWTHVKEVREYFKSVVPWLVNYTADRDLWKWELNDSRAINAWLRSHPFDFESWDMFHDSGLIIEMKQQGEAILRSQANTVQAKVDQSHKIRVSGRNGYAANATTLISETAGALGKLPMADFGLTWFEDGEGKRIYSLRSDRMDVSTLAKQFGGGGHKSAAGFTLKAGQPHPWTTKPVSK